MASLKKRFPDLHTLIIYFYVDVCDISDEAAKTGLFWDMKIHIERDIEKILDPRATQSGTPSTATLRSLVGEVLRSAQEQGPGSCKLFKLEVDRWQDSIDFGYLAENGALVGPRPWYLRCDGIDFSKESSEYASVVQKAWDTRCEVDMPSVSSRLDKAKTFVKLGR